MSTQIDSDLKSKISRTNGAKSRGPVTLEGRAASARNSIRHGLRAKSIVLPTESEEEFQSLLDSYNDQFDPQTGVERELVEAMAAARWRLHRVCAIETMLLNNEMLRRTEQMDADFEEHSFIDVESIDRLTFTFQRLADGGQALALLIRYEGTLNRSHDRAFKQLHILQAARNRPQPNEPTPGQAQRNQPIPGPSTAPTPVTEAPVSQGKAALVVGPPEMQRAPSPESDPGHRSQQRGLVK